LPEPTAVAGRGRAIRDRRRDGLEGLVIRPPAHIAQTKKMQALAENP
jgi:hypothetical protein